MYYLCEHLSSCYWTEGITYWMLLELEFQPYISPNAEIHSCKKKSKHFFLLKNLYASMLENHIVILRMFFCVRHLKQEKTHN